jgi:acyl-CoA synthetase (AMP-forming)/AMP-acid ligase II
VGQCQPKLSWIRDPRFRFRPFLVCWNIMRSAAPTRRQFSLQGAHRHIEEVGRTLRTMGIGRRDRIAVVLPNGPEMAVAFLAVTAWAVCVPINPAYGAEELDSYFADLRPRVLITQGGVDSPARRVALARAVQVVDLVVEPNAAGSSRAPATFSIIRFCRGRPGDSCRLSALVVLPADEPDASVCRVTAMYS